MKIKVTICLPVYNEELFLSECIQSILDQTWSDFALYIGDNASTDSTYEICQRFAEADRRISYYRHPSNIGASANLAFLVDQCLSPYVSFVGAHDLLSPRYLHSLLQYSDRYPSAALIYSQMSAIDGFGHTIRPNCGDSIDTRNKSILAASRLVQLNLYGNMVYGIYRTSLLKLCHLNIACRGPDHILIQELVLMGTIIHHKESLYLMRDMSGINRTKSMSYDDFCRSQLIRIDPTFFSKGPRRIHWHWLYMLISVIVTTKTSFRIKLIAISSASICFAYRWKRQLLREIVKPLKATG